MRHLLFRGALIACGMNMGINLVFFLEDDGFGHLAVAMVWASIAFLFFEPQITVK